MQGFFFVEHPQKGSQREKHTFAKASSGKMLSNPLLTAPKPPNLSGTIGLDSIALSVLCLVFQFYIKHNMTVSPKKRKINFFDIRLSLSTFILFFPKEKFTNKTEIGIKNRAVPIPAKTSLKKCACSAILE
jgi:hypothetical protein